jgi:alginate O-acetyltransferase complex protein AlgI
MMGIRLPENFNWPYLSRSIGEFWRRWHISLSSWIRDYVYIPLGGSRNGVTRKAGNAFLAMALCGLWHGAAWNFVVWGLYHGVGLAAAAQLRAPREWAISISGPLATVTERLLTIASWAITLIFVHIGWLLFFYPVGRAVQMTRLLFSPA